MRTALQIGLRVIAFIGILIAGLGFLPPSSPAQTLFGGIVALVATIEAGVAAITQAIKENR